MHQEFVHIDINLELFLIIMAHELDSRGEHLGALALLWHGVFIRLLLLNCRREYFFRTEAFKSDSVEEMERLSGLIDAAELHFRAILNKRDLEALLHLPRGDLVAELMHEHLHDVVAHRVPCTQRFSHVSLYVY